MRRAASRRAASRAPAPLAGLLDQVASGATSIASGDKRQQINEIWRADVAPLCQRALAGRYPVANAAAEVTLDDFSRLFAPNGLIDGFFQQHLRPFVDMSSTPWQWQSFDGIELGDLVRRPGAVRAGGEDPRRVLPVRRRPALGQLRDDPGVARRQCDPGPG